MNTEQREPSRFDYVAYDAKSTEVQAKLKLAAQRVEQALITLGEAIDEMDLMITVELGCDTQAERARENLAEVEVNADEAFAYLEQSYMWCGKEIRDQQRQRNGSAPLQESRGNE